MSSVVMKPSEFTVARNAADHAARKLIVCMGLFHDAITSQCRTWFYETLGMDGWNKLAEPYDEILQTILAVGTENIGDNLKPKAYDMWQAIVGREKREHPTKDRFDNWCNAVTAGYQARMAITNELAQDLKPDEAIRQRIDRDLELLGQSSVKPVTSETMGDQFEANLKLQAAGEPVSNSVEMFMPRFAKQIGGGLYGQVILSGLEGSYKSMLAGWWAVKTAERIKDKKGVVVICAGDMEPSKYHERFVARKSGYSSDHFVDYQSAVLAANAEIKELPIIYFPPKDEFTSSNILSFVRGVKQQHSHIELLIIDTLEDVDVERHATEDVKRSIMNRNQRLFKRVFMGLEIPAHIIIHHVNRDIFRRRNAKWNDADLNQTGAKPPDLILFTTWIQQFVDHPSLDKAICEQWGIDSTTLEAMQEQPGDNEDVKIRKKNLRDNLRKKIILTATKARGGKSYLSTPIGYLEVVGAIGEFIVHDVPNIQPTLPPVMNLDVI